MNDRASQGTWDGLVQSKASAVSGQLGVGCSLFSEAAFLEAKPPRETRTTGQGVSAGADRLLQRLPEAATTIPWTATLSR